MNVRVRALDWDRDPSRPVEGGWERVVDLYITHAPRPVLLVRQWAPAALAPESMGPLSQVLCGFLLQNYD